jgi:elongation factor P--beta-lysine ligase
LFNDYPFLTTITERRYLNDIKKLLLKIKSEPSPEAVTYRKNFVNYIHAIDDVRKNNIALVAPELAKELFDE